MKELRADKQLKFFTYTFNHNFFPVCRIVITQTGEFPPFPVTYASTCRPPNSVQFFSSFSNIFMYAMSQTNPSNRYHIKRFRENLPYSIQNKIFLLFHEINEFVTKRFPSLKLSELKKKHIFQLLK